MPTATARDLRHAPDTPDASEVLAKAVLRASKELGLTAATLGKIVGASEATVSRMASGGRGMASDSKQGQLALLLIRVYRSLDALVGNDAAGRAAWLGSYNRVLNAVPREALFTPDGLVRVLAYLDGARAPS